LSDASAAAELLVICGPTAAGKSAVALWLAEQRPTTIISADSRQAYRRFDIGTAKPSADERRRVPHRGVDVVEPTERYSAAAWSGAAGAWIEDARAAGRLPLLVGGTGLYLRALFEGLFVEPPLDPVRRAALIPLLDAMPLAELRCWAERLDPARAHLGRTQLSRSIEIALLTGRRLIDLHRAAPRERRWRPRYLLIDPGPTLAGRIASRIDTMLDHGWPDEVEELMRTVPSDAPAWNATGYDAVRALVRGEISRGAAHEQILIATRQYAKRQRTWFRHQLAADRVTVLDPTAPDWRARAAAWVAGA
jgi:tRNA dimethylallyltransferase